MGNPSLHLQWHKAITLGGGFLSLYFFYSLEGEVTGACLKDGEHEEGQDGEGGVLLPSTLRPQEEMVPLHCQSSYGPGKDSGFLVLPQVPREGSQ